MRPCEVLASVLFFSSACTASRAGWAPIEALNGGAAEEPLLRRQAASSFDLSFSGEQGNTASQTTARATQTSDNNNNDATTSGDSSNTDDNSSGTASRTGSGTRQTGSRTSSGSSDETFDARLPAGGVSMITPNALTTQYYKIQDHVTFVWNYTSLSITPSAIDILASVSKSQETFTLAQNVSVEQTQSFVWDTGAFQASATVQLLTETYTLLVYDANGAVTDTAKAGYLAPFNQFTFGMYLPQAYTPMAEYVCATCNGATSLEKQTWLALLGMVGVTVVTFGWFTGVAGLW